ncbi:Protein of unknown function [Gryllus bimaculatus]|nr:Protein of unknown function [Gryllus bimaculatus]
MSQNGKESSSKQHHHHHSNHFHDSVDDITTLPTESSGAEKEARNSADNNETEFTSDSDKFSDAEEMSKGQRKDTEVDAEVRDSNAKKQKHSSARGDEAKKTKIEKEKNKKEKNTKKEEAKKVKNTKKEKTKEVKNTKKEETKEDKKEEKNTKKEDTKEEKNAKKEDTKEEKNAKKEDIKEVKTTKKEETKKKTRAVEEQDPTADEDSDPYRLMLFHRLTEFPAIMCILNQYQQARVGGLMSMPIALMEFCLAMATLPATAIVVPVSHICSTPIFVADWCLCKGLDVVQAVCPCLAVPPEKKIKKRKTPKNSKKCE